MSFKPLYRNLTLIVLHPIFHLHDFVPLFKNKKSHFPLGVHNTSSLICQLGYI